MPVSSPRLSIPRSLPVVVLLSLLVAAPLGLLGPAPRAGAAVEHATGFAATVDGYRSWYGSYRLGVAGEVWCIDHGIAAPDEALGYQPAALDAQAPETRRAIAWAAGHHGRAVDRVGAAALMLVLHDLMGATYPSGRLDVDRLDRSRLTGFEGLEDEVLARARAVKSDAVARAHLRGPFSLRVSLDEAPAGRSGTLHARLADATGAAVEGIRLHPVVRGAVLAGPVDRVTDAGGGVAWPFEARPGSNHFEVIASVPDLEVVALQATRGRAQRVVRPSSIELAAVAEYEAAVPRRFSIHKRGDGEPLLPVTGARFSVSGVGSELVVGDDGRTPAIELLPGEYVVTEVSPPPGYASAGPWGVRVSDADVILEVLDTAHRGRLRIDKVDAVTGARVDGAAFAVAVDRDDDPATFEVSVEDHAAPLLPGRYAVREVRAPPGYRLASEPVIVEVRPGEEAVATIADMPFSTVEFVKRPALAGATFAVRLEVGGEVGRCTTGPDGHCALAPDALDAAGRYCWDEVAAPAGWGLAPGACFTAGDAGSTLALAVDEPPLPPSPAADTGPVVLPAAAPAPAPPPSPDPPPPVAPSVPASTVEVPQPVELPRTGAPAGMVRLSVAGGLLVVAGLVLMGAGPLSPAASSSGRQGRRDPRSRRRA